MFHASLQVLFSKYRSKPLFSLGDFRESRGRERERETWWSPEKILWKLTTPQSRRATQQLTRSMWLCSSSHVYNTTLATVYCLNTNTNGLPCYLDLSLLFLRKKSSILLCCKKMFWWCKQTRTRLESHISVTKPTKILNNVSEDWEETRSSVLWPHLMVVLSPCSQFEERPETELVTSPGWRCPAWRHPAPPQPQPRSPSTALSVGGQLSSGAEPPPTSPPTSPPPPTHLQSAVSAEKHTKRWWRS